MEENVRRGVYRSEGAACRDSGRFVAAGPEVDRFLSKLDISSDPPHWLWAGGLTQDGYGRFTRSDGTEVRAHRYAWELFKGPIPDGYTIDHLEHCLRPACCRPRCLEPVTNSENLRRRWERRRRMNGAT